MSMDYSVQADRPYRSPHERIEGLDRTLEGELQELKAELEQQRHEQDRATDRIRQIEDALSRFEAAMNVVNDGRVNRAEETAVRR
jgi:hypothetical protein